MPSSERHEHAHVLPHRPSALHDAIVFAETVTIDCDRACREATVLAVTELGENALKYAASGGPGSAATIAIYVRGKIVRVRAKNAVGSRRDAESVLAQVSKIASSESITDLYRERLRELYDNPRIRRARLGLLRLAFEGRFRLSCSYDSEVLEIVAERTCEESP